MTFFHKVKIGILLFLRSLKLIPKYPSLAIPPLFSVAIFSLLIYYLSFKFFDEIIFASTLNMVVSVFIVIYLMILTFVMSNTFSVELIEHMEGIRNAGWLKTISEFLFKDLFEMFFLSIVWFSGWILLFVIEFFFSIIRNPLRSKEMSIQEASSYLSQGLRFNRATLHALSKVYKLIMYLTIPAYAWEDLKFRKTFSRSLNVLKTNLVNFSESFALSEMGAFIAFAIPLTFYLLGRFEIMQISQAMWMAIIIISSFFFIVSIYVEQIVCALIFMYNVRLEESAKLKKSDAMPEILKEFDDLLFK